MTSHISSSKERFRAEVSTEFQKFKPEHILCSFQDGRAFFADETASGKQIHGQKRPKRSPFFSAGTPKVTKAHKILNGRVKFISLFARALLWRQHQSICRSTKNSHFSVEETECSS